MSEKTTYPAKVMVLQDYSNGGYKQVVINRGSEHGVLEGMMFLIYALGDEMFDPETGEPLGQLEIVRGKGYATHVQAKMTTITSKTRKEYTYTKPHSLQGMLVAFQGAELRKEIGEIVPFNCANEGDLAKPI